MIISARFSVVGLFAASCALVAYLSLAPSGTIPQSNEIDKLLHMLGYGGLLGLGGLVWTGWRIRTVLFASLLVYGGLLEVAQDGLPQHQASLLDLSANVAGMLLALIGLMLVDRGRRRFLGTSGGTTG